MGARIVSPREENTETMQSALGRMAGPGHPQSRVVARGGRETASFGQVDADAVAHHCADCGPHCDAVS